MTEGTEGELESSSQDPVKWGTTYGAYYMIHLQGVFERLERHLIIYADIWQNESRICVSPHVELTIRQNMISDLVIKVQADCQ